MWSPGMVKDVGQDDTDDKVVVDLNEWQVTRLPTAKKKSGQYDVQVTYLPTGASFSFSGGQKLTDSECIAVALNFFQDHWLTDLLVRVGQQAAR
ncbi:hypothetical protein [Deinococcus soli (ex Cha et al. 2016)]|uniref:Uncharacterized protein n=2 Tax=Deinococcus soli (ex Cha et al. 2016) TaxID=1309411 RepID=A0AAE3XD58_9DEIO|nr:hypothetical protein [Deinococcus soli (ex Cha et al. 2016)]MDR6218723.1 hypothetical protein [Deinococcus soli (ex Cha et al. 2016)]MDR6328520.1 hypothetical protein [Deinococcus soli (ex Cha et al. 2016)]MDR6753131.1 hypothetical protein [Deinococcus soli (ex Cha et al. 2016)]